MSRARVLGVDACRTGWVGIAWAGGHTLAAYAATTLAEIVARCRADGPVAVVGVDMPIGLSDDGARRADMDARGLLGPRRSAVFETPVRAALEATDHETASRVNRAATGRKVSIQAYGLRHRILEVDAWLRAVPAGARPPVHEVHPEVSFAHLAGRSLPHSKRTWAGIEERRVLLDRAGLSLVGTLGLAGAAAGVDDVLDAAAVAWTATRIDCGTAFSLPDPPQPVGRDQVAAIWV